MRTVEQVATEPRPGDVVILEGDRAIRWVVRAFVEIPRSDGGSTPLVLADREEGDKKQEKIAVNLALWGDFARACASLSGATSREPVP